MRVVRISGFLLVIVQLIWSCKQTDSKQIVTDLYEIPQPEKQDSLIVWLSNQESFNKEVYQSVFYENYSRFIAEKNYEKAAELLNYFGRAFFNNRVGDNKAIKTHINFLARHEADISNRYKSGLMFNLGALYLHNSQPDSAKIYLTKATEVPATDYYSLQNQADAHTELGFFLLDYGVFDQALINSTKAIESFKLLRDSSGIIAATALQSSIYTVLQDYKKSTFHIEQAIDLAKKKGANEQLLQLYLSKLELYESSDSTKMYAFIDTLFTLFQAHNFNNDYYKMMAYSWKITQLLKEKKINEAGKLIREIKPVFDRLDERSIYFRYIKNVAAYDKITSTQTIESSVFKDAIVAYKKSNDALGIWVCYSALKEVAVREKDYKSALFYSEGMQAINDSIVSQELIVKAKELAKKYETEKNEQRIKLQESELSRKNWYILALIAALASILLAGLLYITWIKQKRITQEKANNIGFTKQLLENTEDERKRIAVDLHDSISHELLNLKTIFRQDLTVVNSKIDRIINDIRSISRNLHPVMFDKIGLLPNLEQLLERLGNQNNFFISSDFDYSGSLNSAAELQIYRIVQEALTNIIKYAGAHAAKITITENDSDITIEIKDNGKGFDVQAALNSGKAFGLHNIIERARVIGGKAIFSSSEKGTIITLVIPKKA